MREDTPAAAAVKSPDNAPRLALTRRVRATPFTERVNAAGVKAYTVYNHMLLPAVFRSLEQDYWHLREHVQLWDVSCERQVEISGPDAGRLVQLMSARDVTSKFDIGQCKYAPLVDVDGGIINDPIIIRVADRKFWLSTADADVLLWAKGLACGFGLDVEICEPDIFPLAVQGPKAEDLMAGVFGEAVRNIRFFRCAYLSFKGREMLVARSGWSKQGGFEIYLNAPELGEQLWDALWACGQAYNVDAGCPNLIERIEAGLLSYGADMTRDHTPLECGLEKFCALDGDIDFLGKKALLAQRRSGITRKIFGLLIDGPPLPASNRPWQVFANQDLIGEVTSSAFSPRVQKNLCFAMLKSDASESASGVDVDCHVGARQPATVCTLPFAI